MRSWKQPEGNPNQGNKKTTQETNSKIRSVDRYQTKCPQQQRVASVSTIHNSKQFEQTSEWCRISKERKQSRAFFDLGGCGEEIKVQQVHGYRFTFLAMEELQTEWCFSARYQKQNSISNPIQKLNTGKRLLCDIVPAEKVMIWMKTIYLHQWSSSRQK